MNLCKIDQPQAKLGFRTQQPHGNGEYQKLSKICQFQSYNPAYIYLPQYMTYSIDRRGSMLIAACGELGGGGTAHMLRHTGLCRFFFKKSVDMGPIFHEKIPNDYVSVKIWCVLGAKSQEIGTFLIKIPTHGYLFLEKITPEQL